MTEMDTQRIIDFLENKIRTLGYEPEEIVIKHSGKYILVRIVIDKPDRFISLKDCSYVSKNIETYLEDMIPHRFIIEVSSPGADRELKKDSDFERFKGMYVEVFTRQGQRIVGKLIGKVEDKIYIMLQGEKGKEGKIRKEESRIIDFQIHNISKVKLYPMV